MSKDISGHVGPVISFKSLTAAEGRQLDIMLLIKDDACCSAAKFQIPKCPALFRRGSSSSHISAKHVG